MAVSPDGRLVATGGSADGLMKVFEVASGREIRSLVAPAGATYTLAYTGDGRFLLASHADETFRVWNAQEGTEVRRLAAGYVHTVACSRDGRWVAFPLPEGGLAVVEAGAWERRRTFEGHPGGTSYVAFHPHGRHLASTGADGTLRVLDLAGRKPFVTLAPQVGNNSRLAFSADGRRLVVAGTDGLVRVFGRDRK
ncbi:MAG: WD40 repeat domain-containing protein [Planctomycetota bacterium]